MRLVGVTGDGAVAFVRPLDHGADLYPLAFDQGYVVEEPMAAHRAADGQIELRLKVRPVTGESRPVDPGRARDADLELTGSEEIEVRQRIAAYAIVTSERGLLATEFSDRTSVPGRWGLPGGGIDDHEEPSEAVLREVIEETQQVVTLGPLVEVQTSHWVGRSPRNTIEDYHAVRLVYEATCEHPTEPVVLDIGGTTESARWVEQASWRTLAWTAGWQQILRRRI